MKAGKIILYLMHLVLTGCILTLGGTVYQVFIWRWRRTLEGIHVDMIPFAENMLDSFRGYNANYAFSSISVLCWFAIVFVTLLSWWQRKPGREMFVRVAVTTWFAFLVVLALGVTLYWCISLPLRLILAEPGSFPLSDVLGVVVTVVSWGMIVFAVALIVRCFWRKKSAPLLANP